MSVCLLSPSSFYSCCLEQANLNFWQFLLPSHDIIPAQTDCSPNQEKRNIEEPNIEKQKQKLVSLCFTFAFCCCFFSAHISADLLRYFHLFLLLFVCAWHQQLTDSSLKAQEMFWGSTEEETERHIKRPHGQLAGNAASFKALKSKPRSGESRLPCPEIEIENA